MKEFEISNFVNLTKDPVVYREFLSSGDFVDHSIPPSGMVASLGSHQVKVSISQNQSLDFGVPIVWEEPDDIMTNRSDGTYIWGLPTTPIGKVNIVDAAIFEAADTLCITPNIGNTAIRSDAGEVLAVVGFVVKEEYVESLWGIE